MQAKARAPAADTLRLEQGERFVDQLFSFVDLRFKILLVFGISLFELKLCKSEGGIQRNYLIFESVIVLIHCELKRRDALFKIALKIIEICLYLVDRSLKGKLCACESRFESGLVCRFGLLESRLCALQRPQKYYNTRKR